MINRCLILHFCSGYPSLRHVVLVATAVILALAIYVPQQDDHKHRTVMRSLYKKNAT